MEADIREELGNEVQQTMDRMQQDYTRRIQQQVGVLSTLPSPDEILILCLMLMWGTDVGQ